MLPARESLRSAVKELLARRIVRGELSPGSPLNLAELATVVGVSVTPLREALIELERDGLVHSILNRGYFVRPLDEAEMRELYPIVAALEVLALRTGPPSAERMRELKSINDQLRRERSPARRMALDDRFHATLLSDCPNTTLLRLLETVKRRLYRYEYAFMSDESLPPHSVRQHAAIIEALAQGRIKQAAVVLDENWQYAPEALAERLRNVMTAAPPPRRRSRARAKET